MVVDSKTDGQQDSETRQQAGRLGERNGKRDTGGRWSGNKVGKVRAGGAAGRREGGEGGRFVPSSLAWDLGMGTSWDLWDFLPPVWAEIVSVSIG